jgi:hypothetical protein
MTNDLRTERVTIMMSPSEVRALDDWSFANRIRSRSEAARVLIERGMAAEARPKAKVPGLGAIARRSERK